MAGPGAGRGPGPIVTGGAPIQSGIFSGFGAGLSELANDLEERHKQEQKSILQVELLKLQGKQAADRQAA